MDARFVSFVRLLLVLLVRFCSTVNPSDCYGEVKEQRTFMG